MIQTITQRFISCQSVMIQTMKNFLLQMVSQLPSEAAGNERNGIELYFKHIWFLYDI